MTCGSKSIFSPFGNVWCGIRAKNEKIFAMVYFFLTYLAELMMVIISLMVLFFKCDKLLVMVNFLLTYLA